MPLGFFCCRDARLAKGKTMAKRKCSAFQVRIDRATHAKLQAAAFAAGISMNQLISGVLRYAAEKGVSLRTDYVVTFGGKAKSAAGEAKNKS